MKHVGDIADFEKQGELKPIIERIRGTEPVDPPADLSARISRSLPDLPEGARSKSNIFVLAEQFTGILRGWSVPANRVECIACFVLAGVFYLVMSVVLTIGLKNLDSRLPHTGWVMLQPQFALLVALGFVSLGALLLRDSRRTIKVVYCSLYVYMGIVLLNSLLVQITLGNTLTMIGLAALTAGGISVGLFLAIATRHYLEGSREVEA